MIRTTACLGLLLSVPLPLSGQGVTLAPFAAADRGLTGDPTLAGLAATVWSGPFGFRVGGAVDVASTPARHVTGAEAPGRVQAWSGDLDMLLSGGRLGVRLGGVEPGLFVGFGGHGGRDAAGSMASIATWSYGVTAGLPVARWLELTGEARYRMPHESDREALPAGVGAGMEFRAGLALHFGRQRGAAGRVGAPATIHIGGGGPLGGSGGGAPARRGSAAAVAASTLATGDRYVGTPYVWGGSSPREGFDCSGFVQYVYARQGIRLPRVSRDQARAGSPLPLSVESLLPGDLLFFAGADGVVDHVAIYAGDRTILHASGSRGAVGYDRLDSRRGSWYRTHMVEARRVIH